MVYDLGERELHRVFVGSSLDWVKSPSSFPQSSVVNESDSHATARVLGPEHPYTTNWPCNLTCEGLVVRHAGCGLEIDDALELGIGMHQLPTHHLVGTHPIP